MILASNGIIASSISGLDADYVAFYNRVIAAGGSLTSTEQSATNQLVLSLKANGIWTAMKAIYPMVGASAADCAQNLKSSSFTGSFTSGWTFASSGITPNGTSAYMDTTLVPSTSLTLNSNSILYYARTANTSSSSDPVTCGSFVSVTQALLLVSKATVLAARLNGTEINGTISGGIGFFAASKQSAISTTIYKNGSVVATGISGGTLPTYSIYLANINANPAYGQGWVNNQFAFFANGDGLTDTQVSNYYTLVQAFQTSLSRNV
jgi:hypothetical protein